MCSEVDEEENGIDGWTIWPFDWQGFVEERGPDKSMFCTPKEILSMEVTCPAEAIIYA